MLLIKKMKMRKFNRELKKNDKLKNKLNELSLKYKDKEKEEYINELLKIFGDEGIDISSKELKTLLSLRRKSMNP